MWRNICHEAIPFTADSKENGMYVPKAYEDSGCVVIDYTPIQKKNRDRGLEYAHLVPILAKAHAGLAGKLKELDCTASLSEGRMLLSIKLEGGKHERRAFVEACRVSADIMAKLPENGCAAPECTTENGLHFLIELTAAEPEV